MTVREFLVFTSMSLRIRGLAAFEGDIGFAAQLFHYLKRRQLLKTKKYTTMKRLFISAALVLGSLTSFASTSPITNSIVKSISVQDEYTEIKLEELPAPITESLKKSFPNAVLTKAYKNAASQYKLDVTVGEKTGNLFANADGTWIQK